MKPEQSITDTGSNPGLKSLAAGASSAPQTSGNYFSRAWSKMRSWFEVPYGYEDETGFHYGHEPKPVQALATPAAPATHFRETFTDSAHGSAMFMAATSGETAPPPKPEQPKDSETKSRSLKTTLA